MKTDESVKLAEDGRFSCLECISNLSFKINKIYIYYCTGVCLLLRVMRESLSRMVLLILGLVQLLLQFLGQFYLLL